MKIQNTETTASVVKGTFGKSKGLCVIGMNIKLEILFTAEDVKKSNLKGLLKKFRKFRANRLILHHAEKVLTDEQEEVREFINQLYNIVDETFFLGPEVRSTINNFSIVPMNHIVAEEVEAYAKPTKRPRSIKGMSIMHDEGKIASCLVSKYGSEPEERLMIILADRLGNVIKKEKTVSIGSRSQSQFSMSTIVESVAETPNARVAILAHNHPSGHTNPSPEDLNMTIETRKFMKMVDCILADHFIITAKEVYSMAEGKNIFEIKSPLSGRIESAK